MSISLLIGPLFGLIALITVAILAARGKLPGGSAGHRFALTDPTCAACGYDVRTTLARPDRPRRCPECGADLDAADAVRFGRYAPTPGWFYVGPAIGVSAMLSVLLQQFTRPIPAIIPFAPAVFTVPTTQPSVANWGIKTNTDLLAELAAPTADEDSWKDAIRRLEEKRFSAAEVDEAIDVFVATPRAADVSKVDPVASFFLDAALANGSMADASRLKRLSETVIRGPNADRPPRRVRAGRRLYVSFQTPDALNLSDHRLLMAARACTANGVSLPLRSAGSNGPSDPSLLSTSDGFLSVSVPANLPPGPHTLRFDFDMGLTPVTSKKRRSSSSLPGQKANWRSPLVVWERTVELPIVVVANGQPLRESVTDPTLDPTRGGCVRPARVLIGNDDGHYVRIEWAGKFEGPVPVDSILWVRHDRQDTLVGSIDSTQLNTRFQSALGWRLRPGQRVDLVLKPADLINGMESSEHDRVWGKEIVFNDVPVEREAEPARGAMTMPQ